ncbi:MAG: UDP-glucose 4-epimerase [Chloroflexota bacterium]|nr:UDP-glucose 4-epimerase [Chloroflexota bacterium]
MTRTVLITGGAGFIGSNLAARLAAAGDRVRILDDLSMGNPAYLDGVPHQLIARSLADRAAIDEAVDGVDAVVHLAARAGIPDSVTDPVGTFEANVARLLDVLDAARLGGVRRFVFASSNAAAGDHEPPADELDLPHPVSPYGASKLAGEAYCQAYAATYGLAACALRFSNAYGPRSLHKRSVVAAWLRAALTGAPIEIHGDGRQTRDFVFVDDLADAVRAAIDAPEATVAGELFQAGTGIETTVNELAETIQAAVGRRLEVRHRPARAGDVRRNVSRVDKAAERLGYRATVPLAEGIARTAAWFRTALADPGLAAIVPHAASGSE